MVAGVKRTTFFSRGPSATACSKRISPMAPRSVPWTARSVVLSVSAETVRWATSSDGRSSRVTTCGLARVMGPLSVTYTSLHRPMFLSGGMGFQSTHVTARSVTSGAKTSTATALRAPGRAQRVTSSE